MNRTVIVTDGEQRAALAVTRSLGEAGWRVIVVGGAERTLASVSRWCAAGVAAPDALADPRAFAAAVGALAARESAGLVLPIGEGALLALASHRELLGNAVLPWPNLDIVRRTLDKAAVLAAAGPCGLAIPLQRECERAESVIAAAAEIGFPLVLKPSRSIGEAEGTRRKVGVVHVASGEALAAALAELPAHAWPLLVQRQLRGDGIGVFVLRWQNEIKATFAHRRLREKPPSGGVSVLAEAAVLDPELEAAAIRLLEMLNWQGVAMVECKRDEANGGRPTLMEINGRFWGSLQLAIDAGVNFPVLLAECATGAPPVAVRRWRVGTRLRWCFGDRDHLLLVGREAWRRGGIAAVVAAWSQWRRTIGDAHPEVWRSTDPRPGRFEAWRWLQGR